MNFIKQIACGLLAITLPSTTVSASSHPVANLKSEPDLQYVALIQFFILSQQTQIQRELKIRNDTSMHNGFELKPDSFLIHLPKDESKAPAYCGYDEKNRNIVPIKLSANHMTFDGLMEILNYVTKRDNKGIFEHLYKDKAEIFKLLWENPYGDPESKLTALTGFIYNAENDKLEVNENISTMVFDAEEFLGSHAAEKFFPRVFSVTYDKFKQIQQQYPNINFLEGIDKLLTYKKKYPLINTK